MSVLEEQFAEWYGSVQVEVSEERFKARRAGVSEAAKAAQAEDLEPLIRVAHGRPLSEEADAEPLERFRSHFRERDESFGKGKKKELSVLAGSALAVILTAPGRTLPLSAALAVESAGFLRWKCPVPLGSYAGTRLTEEAVEVRKSVRGPRTAAKAVSAPLDELPTIEAVGPADLTALAEAVKDAMGKTVESIDEALQQQAQRAKVLDEELDFFWWQQNRICSTVQKPWDTLGQKGAALLAATEAAEITTFQPGPREAGGFLDAAIEKSGRDPHKTRAVSSLINESRGWLRDYDFELPAGFAGLLPLHYCLARCREMKFKPAWIEVVESEIDFKAGTKRTDSEVALQAYGECLLIKLL